MRQHLLLVLTLCLAGLAVGPALAGGDDDDDDGRRGGSLRVGTCKRDITPIAPGLQVAYEAAFGEPGAVNHTDPVYLAGFGNDRRATGYNDRLWARGVVLESKGTRVAIVSVDLIGYYNSEIDTARAMVAPESEIDFVVVTSSHQHEGPDTLGIWGPDGSTTGLDLGYLDFVNAAIAECIDDAAASLEKARLLFATTTSDGLSLGLDPEDDGLGVGDGKVLEGDEALAPETGGRIVDPLITSMQITRRRRPRDVLATLVNFASHPESLGSRNTLVTSDFPHYLRERIEAEYGGLAIWVSGDLGVLQGPLDIDVEDPATGLAAPRRTFDFARVHGTQLAERAIESIAAARRAGDDDDDDDDDDDRKPGDARARVAFSAVDPLDVRLDNPYFRFAIAIGVLAPRGDTLFTDGQPDDSVGSLPPPADFLPAAAGEDLRTEVSALQIGRGAVAVVPGELDPQIGFGYRDALVGRTGAEHTMIFGLGNDEIGYQLPAEKWDDSCHACASWVIIGLDDLCPVQPIDCNTVFRNNVGQEVDPTVSEAVFEAIDGL